MRILVELPTWLGDAVMLTPAFENLITQVNPTELIVAGSNVSVDIFKDHNKVSKAIVLEKNYRALYKLAKELGDFDVVISFRSSFRSKMFLFFLNAKKKFQMSYKYKDMHQVDKYNSFVNESFGLDTKSGDLKLDFKAYKYKKPTIGINPGATYGNAKRWYKSEFVNIAIKLASYYDIVIFGGPNEINIANDISSMLDEKGITNYENLAGKTSIKELCERIAGINTLFTNDSGPMHIAAAYKIHTIAIFGPTAFNETSPYKNHNAIIVTKNLDCAPCMKRKCPIKTHDCMKQIKAHHVYNAYLKLKDIHEMTVEVV